MKLSQSLIISIFLNYKNGNGFKLESSFRQLLGINQTAQTFQLLASN